MTLLSFLAAWVPTEKARTLARAIADAIDATMTRKDAADRMRLTNRNGEPNEALLSEQLSCQKPLNLFRLAEMGEAFWDALELKLAEYRGGLYLTPGTVAVLRGASLIGRRRMLRMGQSAERIRA